MKLSGKKIGICITGSHCTFAKVIPELEDIKKEGAEIYIIFSESVLATDTRFGKADEWLERFSVISDNNIITTQTEAEPIGPQAFLDCVLIAPCTGNTVAKLANGITDTTVLMAAKAQLRNLRPVIIALSTNDGLGNNAKNIGILLNTKNVYFVPFSQDSPLSKPNSLIANMNLIIDTIICALEGRQLQPILFS